MTTATSTPAGRAVVYGNDPRLEQNATAKFAAKRADAQRAAAALNAPQDAPAPAPAEKTANITIEVAPDGLHIRAEYCGPLSSIPAAIERLKAAGVLDLVQSSRPAPVTPAPAPAAADEVNPTYNAAGDPCCPVHRKALSDGVRGLFCSAKAKDGQVADKKGYCGLKFNA